MTELPLNQVICGDCAQVLQGFPENSIDLVVTSPPHTYIINPLIVGMRDMKESNLAYIAGFLDGEGSFMIRRTSYRKNNKKYGDCVNPQYNPRITCKNTVESPLILIKELFGGTLYKSKRIYESHNGHTPQKILYVWEVSNRKAITLLNSILPFLLIKKKQAQALLALDEAKHDAKRDKSMPGFHGKPYHPDSIAEFEALYQFVKKLNGGENAE